MFMGKACCRAVSKLSENCVPKIFTWGPFNPLFPPHVNNYCASMGAAPSSAVPVPAPETPNNHYYRDKYFYDTKDCHRYRGYGHGWFVVDKTSAFQTQYEHVLSVFNPITGDQILLPSLDNACFLRKAVLSSCPVISNGKDCIVMAVIYHYQEGASVEKIVFCKLGDEKWTLIQDEGLNFETYYVALAYCNGLFYVADGLRQVVLVCDIGTSMVVKQIAFPIPFIARCKKIHEIYLLELYGKLFLVFKHVINFEFVRFNVFRLKQRSQNWARVNNLGDYTLFLSVYSSFSLMAYNSGILKRNCIYFTFKEELGIFKEMGIFNIGDGSVEYLTTYGHGSCCEISHSRIWITTALR
ncbi:hypothetical protein GIB67_008192 [Kingdonia uniflora]|uniref:DUF295 domain-containing protein n=1 Tax=Kingdonia uniflora TaxID=39325 RepID=A0A7J7NWM7_9MAGN|nr:hypothetical protein GIB67_008192 [Kingdonia uniflora]